MPCDSSYLNPTERERELRRSANLYQYVLQKLGREVPAAVTKAASDYYGGADYVPALCNVLTEILPSTRERIIYESHERPARDLADWWEDHQVADRARLIEEGSSFAGIEVAP